MISAWWLVAAFIAGGYAGIVLMAVLHVASGDRASRQRLAREADSTAY